MTDNLIISTVAFLFACKAMIIECMQPVLRYQASKMSFVWDEPSIEDSMHSAKNLFIIYSGKKKTLHLANLM